MVDGFRRGFTLLLIAACLGSAVVAVGDGARASHYGSPQEPPKTRLPPDMPMDEKWRRRFPQPVLVSDLIGRLMLDQGQGVLGRIDTLVRTPDGEVHIVFSRKSWFGFGGPTVAVPAKVAALLGQFVMVIDIPREEVEKLPAWSAGSPPVDRASRIEMALTKH